MPKKEPDRYHSPSNPIRPNRRRSVCPIIKKSAAVLAVVWMAGPAIVPAGRADEADAKRLLKAMSDYLAAQKVLSFDYDVNLELVSTQQQKIGLASSGTLTLSRPDKLHLTRTGGFANVEMVFGGNTLTHWARTPTCILKSRRLCLVSAMTMALTAELRPRLWQLSAAETVRQRRGHALAAAGWPQARRPPYGA